MGLPVVAWGSGIPPKGQKGEQREQNQGWAEGLGRESRGLGAFGKGQRRGSVGPRVGAGCGREGQDLALGGWVSLG